MRVLVTGAAGLIGSGISERLAATHDVIGLDARRGPGVAIVDDLLEVHRWGKEAGKIDAVVHVAALHAPHVGRVEESRFREVNVEGTARLLDFARRAGARHFVLTSTTSLFGDALEPEASAAWINEQTLPLPRDIYDETKLEAEQLVTSASDVMAVTVLRMSRCFPEQAGAMAWYRLHRGVDRRDVAEAHALALRRTGRPATYVISAKTAFEPDDCAGLLHSPLQVIERRYPGLAARMAAKGWAAPASIGRVYDCALAVRELGFQPRHDVLSCLAGDWDPLPSR